MVAIKNVIGMTVALTATTFAMYQNYYNEYGQFYPAMRQFSRNGTAMILSFLQWLCMVYLCTKGVIRVFFGNLRSIEVDNINQNFWMSITDTALTLTIFHDDLHKESVQFVILFSILFSAKVLHWLFYDRIDSMEATPVITWGFRFRMMTLATCLTLFDLGMLYLAYEKIMGAKQYWMVFALEYALLLSTSVYVFVKFCFHSIDLASSSPWINKNAYLMQIRLFFCAFRLFVQVCFVYYLTKTVSFPLFAIRPVIVELKVLKNTFNSIVKSKEAIKKLSRFPSATLEDFENKDTCCIICHEEMVVEENGRKVLTGDCKKLNCGHIFHTTCLRSWFLRQQTCPICRDNILTGQVPPPRTAQREANDIQELLRQLQDPNGPPIRLDNLRRQQRQVQNNNGVNVQQTTVTGTIPVSSVAEAKIVPGVVPIPTTPIIPKPPVDMAKLMEMDEKELKEMEGNEKKALVKRIHHLRQVRTLCDVTLTMMTQYDNLDIDEPQNNSTGVDMSTQTDEILEEKKEEENKKNSPILNDNQNESDVASELRRRRMEAFSNQN